MERLRTRKTAHPNGSDARSLLLLPPKNTSTPRAYIMVKAMLGRTVQEKQEDRALATGQAETRPNRRDGGDILCDVIVS